MKYKQIPNTNYEVNPQGEVRHTVKRNVMKVQWKRGYPYVRIWNKVCKKKKNYYLHRIVCELFIPKPQTGVYEVGHRVPDRHNYAVTNLEWTTRYDNMQEMHSRLRLRHT